MDAEGSCGMHACGCAVLPPDGGADAHRRAFRRLFDRRYFLLDADESHGRRAFRPEKGGLAAPKRAVYSVFLFSGHRISEFVKKSML